MKQKNAIIRATAKCSDLWSHEVIGKDGRTLSEYSGYVPSFMPGEHYGDYVMLDIDPYTGKILNWKPWKKAKKSRKVSKKV
jgi:hypothetical protein